MRFISHTIDGRADERAYGNAAHGRVRTKKKQQIPQSPWIFGSILNILCYVCYIKCVLRCDRFGIYMYTCNVHVYKAIEHGTTRTNIMLANVFELQRQKTV